MDTPPVSASHLHKMPNVHMAQPAETEEDKKAKEEEKPAPGEYVKGDQQQHDKISDYSSPCLKGHTLEMTPR